MPIACVSYQRINKTHDYFFVHKVLESSIDYVKENIPNIMKIHYFSDGCPNQYKNKYHLMNLTYSSDFSLNCMWSFFATCHGKSPCDWIGDLLKRAIVKASLQHPIENQILSSKYIFEFCTLSFKNISFFCF